MLKQHRTAIITVIIVNVLLVLFFVYSNYSMWNFFNSQTELGYIHMDSSLIQVYYAGYLSNGNFVPTGWHGVASNPFGLFFVSTAINLIFIFYFVLSKETKPTHS